MRNRTRDITTQIYETGRRFGLAINTEKIKTILIKKRPNRCINSLGEIVEQVA